MASATTISPSRAFREEFLRRGGADAARCMQCATCSSVCELATGESPFPRRQVLWAQWGLGDRLLADPAIWLCHQCNDCSARCPRDARPGDAIQAIRSLVIEEAGAPRFMARLVGRARDTWPLLLGIPVLFWAIYIQAVNGFRVPRLPLVYGDVVPQWMIYSVFLPAGAFAAAAALVGARRCWAAWGAGAPRSGSLLGGLWGIALDVLGHRRFGSCGVARPRQKLFRPMNPATNADVGCSYTVSGSASCWMYSGVPRPRTDSRGCLIHSSSLPRVPKTGALRSPTRLSVSP